MLHLYLGLLLFSFLTTGVFVIPFINLLYHLKFQRQQQKTLDFQNHHTPIFDKFHSGKSGTPVGGGLLIIVSVCHLFLLLLPLLKLSRIFISANYQISRELEIIFFTFPPFMILIFILIVIAKKLFALALRSFLFFGALQVFLLIRIKPGGAVRSAKEINLSFITCLFLSDVY